MYRDFVGQLSLLQEGKQQYHAAVYPMFGEADINIQEPEVEAQSRNTQHRKQSL